jgi:hypothetical protein
MLLPLKPTTSVDIFALETEVSYALAGAALSVHSSHLTMSLLRAVLVRFRFKGTFAPLAKIVAQEMCVTDLLHMGIETPSPAMICDWKLDAFLTGDQMQQLFPKLTPSCVGAAARLAEHLKLQEQYGEQVKIKLRPIGFDI